MASIKMKPEILFVVIQVLCTATFGDIQNTFSYQSIVDGTSIPSSVSEKDNNCTQICLNCYMRYCQMKTFLIQVQVNNPDIVTFNTLGQSYEQREIYYVKISNNPVNKKGVVIEANMGAREWITSATAIWIINEMASSRGSILNDIDWYIIPVVNPDGYEYSQTTNREWVKNRQLTTGSCVGINLDRNFSFKWGGAGSTTNPCSQDYNGPSAESAPECKAVANLLRMLKAKKLLSLGLLYNLAAYISFQAFSQLWLYPWGYTTIPVSDLTDQDRLAQKVLAAIRNVNGTDYGKGPGALSLGFETPGCSYDFAKSIDVNYATKVLMRDTGAFGYQLPADQIEVNSKEIYAALEVVATEVRTLPNQIINLK